MGADLEKQTRFYPFKAHVIHVEKEIRLKQKQQ